MLNIYEDRLAKLRREWVEKPEKRGFILRQVNLIKNTAQYGGYKNRLIKDQEEEIEMLECLL